MKPIQKTFSQKLSDVGLMLSLALFVTVAIMAINGLLHGHQLGLASNAPHPQRDVLVNLFVLVLGIIGSLAFGKLLEERETERCLSELEERSYFDRLDQQEYQDHLRRQMLTGQHYYDGHDAQTYVDYNPLSYDDVLITSGIHAQRHYGRHPEMYYQQVQPDEDALGDAQVAYHKDYDYHGHE